jgi:putative transposase
MEDDIKRWTAKRKTALLLDIIQGKTTVAEASRAYDLPSSEIEEWVEDGKKGMENALRTKPLEIKEQYERHFRELQEAYGEAMLELHARKKIELSAGQRGRQMILELEQALKDDGVTVRLVKLCRWFTVPRRTVYLKPTKGAHKVQGQFVKPIKAMIEENPSFGYRTVAHLLDMNKNTVQRVFQIMGWQVRKRPVGFRPRIQALPSVATAPNERWATDMCRVWCGRDNWATLALVIDYHKWELPGWHLRRSGRSKTAESALEQALIAR